MEPHSQREVRGRIRLALPLEHIVGKFPLPRDEGQYEAGVGRRGERKLHPAYRHLATRYRHSEQRVLLCYIYFPPFHPRAFLGPLPYFAPFYIHERES